MRHKSFFLAIIFLIFCLYGCVEGQKVVPVNSVIAKSGINYVKPQSSIDLIQGEKIKYELWYDKNKWEVIDKTHPLYNFFYKEAKALGLTFDVSFMHKSQEVLCFLVESRIPESFQAISTRVHSTTDVLSEKIRKVNGQDVLYIKYQSKIDDINWIYIFYYLRSQSGIVTVGTFTTDLLFSEHELEMFDLLNGLVDPSLEKQTHGDLELKLIELKKLKDKGLITQQDYDKSKNNLLNKYIRENI